MFPEEEGSPPLPLPPFSSPFPVLPLAHVPPPPSLLCAFFFYSVLSFLLSTDFTTSSFHCPLSFFVPFSAFLPLSFTASQGHCSGFFLLALTLSSSSNRKRLEERHTHMRGWGSKWAGGGGDTTVIKPLKHSANWIDKLLSNCLYLFPSTIGLVTGVMTAAWLSLGVSKCFLYQLIWPGNINNRNLRSVLNRVGVFIPWAAQWEQLELVLSEDLTCGQETIETMNIWSTLPPHPQTWFPLSDSNFSPNHYVALIT